MNQLTFSFTTRDYPGLDKFLGTSSAELAHVLQNRRGQLIYVWGEQGAKKNCLLQAWVAQTLGMGKNVVYIDVTTSPLTESVLETDCLAIDRIKRLSNEEQTLLLVVFSHFRNSSKGFLLLSPRHALQQLVIHEDLRTHTTYCLACEVKPLIDQKKIDALVSMVAVHQVTIDFGIFEYLLSHWRRDMDSLMQMLDMLDNYVVTMGKRITLPLLRQLLKQQET